MSPFTPEFQTGDLLQYIQDRTAAELLVYNLAPARPYDPRRNIFTGLPEVLADRSGEQYQAAEYEAQQASQALNPTGDPVYRVPAADIGDAFALGKLHPATVYKFDGEKGRRLGAAQVRKEVAKMQAAGGYVRTYDECGDNHSGEVAAILVNGGVNYVQITRSNGNKRVHAWVWNKFERDEKRVELDKKGWQWYRDTAEAAEALAKH